MTNDMQNEQNEAERRTPATLREEALAALAQAEVRPPFFVDRGGRLEARALRHTLAALTLAALDLADALRPPVVTVVGPLDIEGGGE